MMISCMHQNWVCTQMAQVMISSFACMNIIIFGGVNVIYCRHLNVFRPNSKSPSVVPIYHYRHPNISPNISLSSSHHVNIYHCRHPIMSIYICVVKYAWFQASAQYITVAISIYHPIYHCCHPIMSIYICVVKYAWFQASAQYITFLLINSDLINHHEF